MAPAVADIAAELGCGEEEVLEAMQASRARTARSMEATVGGGGGGDDDTLTLADGLGEVDGGYELAEHRATLSSVVGELSVRDREILRLRFEEDLAQAEIGQRVGVSQMQVSRVLSRSLATLRTAAERAPSS